jgi:hypothetical protein
MDDDIRVHEAKSAIIQAVVELFRINRKLLQPHIAEEVEMLLLEIDKADVAARNENILSYLCAED